MNSLSTNINSLTKYCMSLFKHSLTVGAESGKLLNESMPEQYFHRQWVKSMFFIFISFFQHLHAGVHLVKGLMIDLLSVFMCFVFVLKENPPSNSGCAPKCLLSEICSDQ